VGETERESAGERASERERESELFAVEMRGARGST
jgi:hypothetical protein